MPESTLNWSSASHSIYLPEIDEEHQALFRMCGRIQSLLPEGGSLNAAAGELREFTAQMAAHFAHEEALMRAAHYGSRAWHRGQHDVARARMAQMERDLEQQDRDAILRTMEFISAWLQTHTAVSDRMMGAHLRSHRRVRPAVQVRKTARPVKGAPSYRRGSRRQPV